MSRKSWPAILTSLGLCLALSGFLSIVSAQSTLPVDVQADLLKRKVVDAYGKGDVKAVLGYIDDYKRLQIALPPALTFVEARVAKQVGENERALAALENYLKTADRNSTEYGQALAMHSEYEAAARAAQKRRSAALLAALSGQMVTIPGGTFQMGDLADDGLPSARPVHTVNLKPFKLGKYEITVELIRSFVFATAYKTEAERMGCQEAQKLDASVNISWSSPGFPQSDVHPVVCVSWNDVQSFIQWLNTETGQRFRLPTEAEWEYAARAGLKDKYVWGSNIDQGCNYANGPDQTRGRYNWERIMQCRDGYFFTAPVGEYAANAFGLYDMAGNVREWTADCHNSSYDGAPNDGSAWSSGDCDFRVHRGGAWDNWGSFLNVSYRGGYQPMFSTVGLGFRLAQDL